MITKTVTKAKLPELLKEGHTIRRGTYSPRRGFPRPQWQLFDPAGEFVGVVRRNDYAAMYAAGQCPAATANGLHRDQEAK